MRYQALLLIIVILISVTAVKGFSFIAESGEIETLTATEFTEAVQSASGDDPRVVLKSSPVLNINSSVQTGYVEEQTRVVGEKNSAEDTCGGVAAHVVYARDMDTGSIVY